MNITKFEQSGFIIESNSGFKLAIDIGNKTSEEKLKGLNVDAFLVSHLHGDHFSLPQIQMLRPKTIYLSAECEAQINNEHLNKFIIKSGDNFSIVGEFAVQVFSVDHGPNITTVPKENFGFLIKVDDQVIYFAGDMFYESGIDVKDLEVDYALIPVGGFYTFAPQEAVSFLRKFKSVKNVIPMHYDKEPQTKDEFHLLWNQAL